MVPLNLLRDPWIPFRHASGVRTMRAAWDLFGEPDDPVVAIASPRADFDGGVAQLLVGLLQAVLGPRDEAQWIDRSERPPSAAQLRSLMEPWAGAFELSGSGPRFQQDSRLAGTDGPAWPTEKLLMDLGLSEGQDLFSRNGSVGALCLPCAAAALATLQSGAPAGGRGHLVSLRGGGPLTTLVVPSPTGSPHSGGAQLPGLWSMLWLNVLPLSTLRTGAPPCDGTLLPWLNTGTLAEPDKPLELAPIDAHPLQAFFAMPRRLWLGETSPGDCGVCGASGVSTVADFMSRPNGIRYTGAWIHPLSPYRRFKEDQWLAFKGDEDGIGYRHWLGLVVAPASSGVRPSLNVQQLRGHAERFNTAGGLRLWAFGYAMDNIRAMAWSEGVMPIYQPREDVLDGYADEIRKLIEAAEIAERYLRFAFKKLIARRPQDVKREPAQISASFWEATEPAFYERARQALTALESANDGLPVREAWHRDLVSEAGRLFDLEVGEADFRAADPGQVARAWNELQRSLYGKKLKTALELPVERVKAAGKRGKRAEKGETP